MADWISFAGSGVGAATNLVGSLIGNHQSSENVKRQIEAQRQENRLNREFNAREAQLNRDFQSGQIASYRRYNSAVAQVARLQEAGFHPSAMLGNIQPQDSGLSSGSQASSNGGISPVGYSPLDLSATSRNIAEARMLESEARKNDAEAGLSEANKVTADAIREGLIKLQNVQINLGDWAAKEKESNVSFIQSSTARVNQLTENAKAELDEIVQRTANYRQDVISKQLDNIWRSKTLQDRIKFESAKFHLTDFQYKRGVAMLSYEMANSAADTNLKYAQAFQSSSMGFYINNKSFLETDEYFSFRGARLTNLHYQNARLQFDLGMDKEFGPTERRLGILQQGFGLAESFMRTVGMFQENLLRPMKFGLEAGKLFLRR